MFVFTKMKLRYAFVKSMQIAAVLVLGMTTARASRIELTAPFGNVVLLSPRKTAGQALKFYGATGSKPRWNIAQWGTPGEHEPHGGLPPFRRHQQRNAMILTSSHSGTSVKIVQTGHGEAIQLSQDGSGLACWNSSGSPREADLFVQTNGGGNRGTLRPGFLRRGSAAIPLAAMSHLYETVTVSMTASFAHRHTHCAVNQSGLLTALVLQNRSAHPTETLFYQLSFSNQCGPGAPGRVKLCTSRHLSPTWFFDQKPFGVDDSLTLLGKTPLISGETRTFHIDLLPRLREVISHGPPRLDDDLAHWTITGVYLGQHIWGGMALHSVWYGYRLVAVTQ